MNLKNKVFTRPEDHIYLKIIKKEAHSKIYSKCFTHSVCPLWSIFDPIVIIMLNHEIKLYKNK